MSDDELSDLERQIQAELDRIARAGPWSHDYRGPHPEGVTTNAAYAKAVLSLVRVGNLAWRRKRLQKT